MEKKFYEIAFIIPSDARFFPSVRSFLRFIRSHFSTLELPEMVIYCSLVRSALTVLLRFEREFYHAGTLKWFKSWVHNLHIEVVELDILSPEEGETVLTRFELVSEKKYGGEYDLEQVLKEIEEGYYRQAGVRREPRIPASVRVHFKNGEMFTSEYADNVSASGMFVRGKVELPLNSRLEMVVELPRSGGDVKVSAKIVHIVTEEKINLFDIKGVPGFGVRFMEFREEGEDRLRNYLKKVAEKKETQ